jgi:hypothetical protein
MDIIFDKVNVINGSPLLSHTTTMYIIIDHSNNFVRALLR